VFLVIAGWTDSGTLPAGRHVASWDEVKGRFGWNERRLRLLEGLGALIDHLRQIGCQRLWIDGSFVTTKDQPGDFDIVWDPDGATLEALDPVLWDLAPPRRSQQVKYGGDILPNVTEQNSGMPFLDFFQYDPETGAAKGIVEVDLTRGADDQE
jgi:hypothetical protein